ncbi:unnamed protein product [Phyllotreta striolata]|uniref:Uncharacterized protein n=1 Tax=Phyllotreta striolata TaxID=444603 RepID=A0A9P0GW21_PHYSR|nr:unnamed protein product [Phyllotreta striolata]
MDNNSKTAKSKLKDRVASNESIESTSSSLDPFEDLNKSLSNVSVESDSEDSKEFSQDLPRSSQQVIKEYDEYVESHSEIESLVLDRPPQFVSIINSRTFREADQELRAKMLYYYHTCLEKKRQLVQAPRNISPILLNVPISNAEEKPHLSSTNWEPPQDIYTTKSGRQTRRKPYFELDQDSAEDFDTEWQSTNRNASSSGTSQKSKRKNLNNNGIISKSSLFDDESLVTKRTWSTIDDEAAVVNKGNDNDTVENNKTTKGNKSSKSSSKRTKTIDNKDRANEITSSRRQLKLETCPLCQISFSKDEIQVFLLVLFIKESTLQINLHLSVYCF